MAQRILYGSLAIVLLIGLFAADARIAAYFGEPYRDAALGSDRAGQATVQIHSIGGDANPVWRRFGETLLAHGSLIPLFTVVVMIAGAREFNRLLRCAGAKPYVFVQLPSIVLLLCAPWVGAALMVSGRSPLVPTNALAVALAAVLTALGAWTVLRRDPSGTLRDVGATLLVIMYLGLLPAYGIAIRCTPRYASGSGAWLLLAILLIVKVSDIGAYFTGKAIGRRKLIPSVSPAKSVEGMVGGLMASGLVSYFAGWGCVRFGSGAETGTTARQLMDWAESLGYPSYAWFATLTSGFGVALSVAAQFGDLLESCFKRDAGAKDTGSVMPQFGGILDLVDSPVFALPVAWCLLAVVGGVV